LTRLSRKVAAWTEENTPMSKWLVLPPVVLAYVAATVSPAAARDRDRDGMPDRWERKYHLAPAKPSAKRDPDRDRLRNRREWRLRTHPRRGDTDRDGLRDGAEVRRFHTNPRKRDTDGDGFRDRCELRKGTNPRKRRSRPRRHCSKTSLEPPPRDLAPPGNPTAPPPGGFPNRATTGVPSGWAPARTLSTDLTITTPGTVVEDVRFTHGADLLVNAPGVTIRRVELQGGSVLTGPSQTGCLGEPTVIEDSTFLPLTGTQYGGLDVTIGRGNYIARRIEIYRRGEGYRAADCGPSNSIRVEDSFTYIDSGPWPTCPNSPHSDGFQAFHGRGATFVNNTIIFGTLCGTSPWYPGYGGKDPNVPTINTGKYNVDRMLVGGGGISYRHQVPGYVTGLRIINDSWYYGPIRNRCSVLSPWEAKIVQTDAVVGPNKTLPANAAYRVTRVVRNQPCNTEVVE
jgi:Bacterial TSP3 repeat